MNDKHNTITDLRFGLVPYMAGSGVHLGCGPARVFLNAVGIDDRRGEAANLIMPLGTLPAIADNAYDFVVVGDAARRTPTPAELVDAAWRILAPGGHLILVQPTPFWYERALAHPDYVIMANLAWGAQRVDVLQKLAPGEGRHDARLATEQLTLGLVRVGGYGDALWAASVLPHFKRQGYHITVYADRQVEEVLRHDPHVDRLFVNDDARVPSPELGAYWAHERARYDHFVNLVESVEKNLLAVPIDLKFFWPDAVRRDVFKGNYLEMVHRVAEAPPPYGHYFYPTPPERAQAQARFTAVTGRRNAVVAASGSTLPKYWPYLDALTDALIARGFTVWLLGELRDRPLAPRAHLEQIGRQWTIREAMAAAQLADVVIGQETALTNAVAFEPMLKVVLLSHSTAENLTKHWVNTVALNGRVPCWPCHRIHYVQNGWRHCAHHEATNSAACQAAITVEQVLAPIDLETLADAPLTAVAA